jgi:hypothetical protein
MPKRGLIPQLPTLLRNEIDTRLITNGFSDYQGTSDWLAEKGHKISSSVLQLYGQKLENRLSDLKLSHDFALYYKQTLPEDTDAKTQLLNDLAQSALLNLLLRLPQTSLFDSDDETDLAHLTKLVCTITRAISDINKSNIVVSKYVDEIRIKQDAKFNELQSEGVKRGIDVAFMRRIKSEVLGLL